MIEVLRTWLLGLTVSSMALSLAESLVVQEGVRRVLRLAGGVLLVIVVVSPLMEVDLSDWDISFADYNRQIAELEEEYGGQQQTQLTASIEEELATYIWDKARQMGLTVEAEVTVAVLEDGTVEPQSAAVTGAYSEALSDLIAEDLGIPREKQNWQEAT